MKPSNQNFLLLANARN